MRLKLYVSSKKVAKRGKNSAYVFTVVDLDKANSYPENFVCLLPHLSPTEKSTSKFYKTFGSQSLQIAKILLTRALRNEKDPAIKAEIQKRLKALKTN